MYITILLTVDKSYYNASAQQPWQALSICYEHSYCVKTTTAIKRANFMKMNKDTVPVYYRT